MGNRAVITTYNDIQNDGYGIYLHWNGGKDSIEPLLHYCKLKNISFKNCDNYDLTTWANIFKIVSCFVGSSTYFGKLSHLDMANFDNGTYIIDDDLNIAYRLYFEGKEQTEYPFDKMMIAIDEAQPASEQLGEDYFKALDTNVDDLTIGDIVLIREKFSGKFIKATVIGYGWYDKPVNGQNVGGVPVVDAYTSIGFENNINNYIFKKDYPNGKIKVII